MAPLTAADTERVRAWMRRAWMRLNAAEAAIARPRIEEGEFDNHFDGAVSALFHIVDAVELARTGVHRRVGEDQEAVMIQSVVATMRAAGVPDVPATVRLIDLNHRRNTSVHGHWTEVLDREALEAAIAAVRQFHRAASAFIERLGVAADLG